MGPAGRMRAAGRSHPAGRMRAAGRSRPAGRPCRPTGTRRAAVPPAPPTASPVGRPAGESTSPSRRPARPSRGDSSPRWAPGTPARVRRHPCGRPFPTPSDCPSMLSHGGDAHMAATRVMPTPADRLDYSEENIAGAIGHRGPRETRERGP
ncbi:hypothetical protein ELQ93_06985 [Labedella gwakjiensis]|uniref:Uncharacterized protein n=1 Tax=Labedella gwakjiensis TaxID=390269 RepID=A0ABY0CAR5_9MICO|nr:hypothetical protein ELQ93_06985 [Labedella gwakjiensis]